MGITLKPFAKNKCIIAYVVFFKFWKVQKETSRTYRMTSTLENPTKMSAAALFCISLLIGN